MLSSCGKFDKMNGIGIGSRERSWLGCDKTLLLCCQLPRTSITPRFSSVRAPSSLCRTGNSVDNTIKNPEIARQGVILAILTSSEVCKLRDTLCGST